MPLPRAFATLLAALLVACATTSIRVRSESDSSANFSSYRTYAWAPQAKDRSGDFGIDDIIRSEVESQLALRGYEPAASGTADVLVDYHAAVETETALRGAGYGRSRTVRYEKGTLTLEILDPAGQKVLWRGSARDALNLRRGQRYGARIPEAVQLILSKLPSR